MMYTFYVLMTKIVDMFPDSPFVEMIGNIEPIKELGYVAYFLPLEEIISMSVSWCAVVVSAKVVMFLYNFIKHKVVDS